MKSKSYLLLASLALTISTPVMAQQYMFTYSKLFSQMKSNTKEDHPDVKMGIFFIDAQSKQNCVIEKAWMEKEEHYEELKTGPGYELLVPLDNNLRQANPLVFVDTPQDKRCDFSMVVMAKKPFEGKVAYQEVEVLLPQMQAMLEQLGGMFASWFTPAVEGVTLEFSPETEGVITLSNGQTVAIVNHKAQVALSQIGPDGWMELPAPTLRVLPYLPKAKK
ncbi:DUF2987 domain-containing protein [Vibrio mimicus]|uniref:DUF2987 domain-containing protein n=1 Tax=Vibrio mimicus TaxID=674 RepID=UPI0002BC03FC|nr:DUF2987 domain-containing protein [Vibrio mimicus]AOW82592.1 hypothetical protein VM_07615 [Vibrio mimicus]EMB51314.1 hypothetical protein D908_04147 [Vibrio mimicus CAIM 602]MBY7674857.1 DUF2987 domain-containing protein [Vibrio mimicus]MBY7726718.1 DUF2987 domain-containing protein [Vibrio mimicus]TXY07572.1 DUF2987 domain-containing protein [Vibrio mimicus]